MFRLLQERIRHSLRAELPVTKANPGNENRTPKQLVIIKGGMPDYRRSPGRNPPVAGPDKGRARRYVSRKNDQANRVEIKRVSRIKEKEKKIKDRDGVELDHYLCISPPIPNSLIFIILSFSSKRTAAPLRLLSGKQSNNS